MEKKKKRNLNLNIICSGLMVKGTGILFAYCLIAGLIGWHFPLFGLGILFLIMEFEMLIIHNNYRIKKLELQQKREW